MPEAGAAVNCPRGLPRQEIIPIVSDRILGSCAAALLVSAVLTALPEVTPAVADPAIPDCGSVSLDYGQDLSEQHVRCLLRLAGGSILQVSSEPAWSFTRVGGGGTTQAFREPAETVGQTGVLPLLADIDRDGKPELLVVTDRGGTGGEPMAVWRLVSNSQQFVRSGLLFGQRRFYQTPEGFFGLYAHSSAASGVVSLYRWVDDKLAAVVGLDVAVAADTPRTADQVRNGNTLCALSAGDQSTALKAAGVDPATAQRRFCTQPWVSTVYQG